MVASQTAASPPALQSGASLSSLAAAQSTHDLRAALNARHPAFAPGALRKLAILGAAGEGIRLAEICAQQGISIAAVIDENPARQGLTVQGKKVTGLDGAVEVERDTPIVIASHRTLLAARRLRERGFRNVAPFALLQAVDPATYRPHMFHEGLLEDLVLNRHRYEALAASLADDFSRRVLDAVIGYRLTMEPEVFAEVVEWDLYNPTGLLQLGPDEVYVDAGTFDGDSIELFRKRVDNRFSRVIGFEPDRATFKVLQERFAADSRIQAVNAGLHAARGELRFAGDASRGSVFAAEGGEVIEVVNLDSVLQGERVTFIKMNIEGSELDALKGAAESIRQWRPRLAISGYHRPSDLWAVPRAIRELVPSYKLYLRQHDGGIIETVCYAIAAH